MRKASTELSQSRGLKRRLLRNWPSIVAADSFQDKNISLYEVAGIERCTAQAARASRR